MTEDKKPTVEPISTFVEVEDSASGSRYGSRGVSHYQEPYAEGFLGDLSLANLERIRRKYNLGVDDGRLAVSDNGDLLLGIVVKNGSGRSQVLVRIDHDEIRAALPLMHARKVDPYDPSKEPRVEVSFEPPAMVISSDELGDLYVGGPAPVEPLKADQD